MRMLDTFSGIGGFARAAKKIWGKSLQFVGHSEIDTDACTVYHKHFLDSKCLGDIQKISFSQEDSLVKMLALLDAEKDLPENGRDSSGKWQELLGKLFQNGSSSKMFPDSYLPTKEQISGRLLPRLSNSGIAWHGECLMLNTSEWLREGDVCGLSEVLEIHVPQKYYLSKKAVEGMVRRSLKWGRGGYVFLQEMVNGTTQRTKPLSQNYSLPNKEIDSMRMSLLSLNALAQVAGQTQKQSSQEEGKILSLTQLEQLTSQEQREVKLKHFPHPQSEAMTTIPQETQNQTTSLPTQSTQDKEVTLPLYGKTLILRKLTPKEKERLMGFPDGWTDELKSDAKRGKGLGNAIVPQVAEELFRRIKELS